MDFESATPLGVELEKRYRRCNYDERRFPDLAAELLADFEFDYEWRATAVADYIASADSVPTYFFSNAPVTLFRAREFYIELLNWTTSSTAIHQHAFSGAFKVVHGGSLHSLYDFEQQQEINADVLLGQVNCRHMERLSVGAIRKILPGQAMAHCLYHLEHPSATLVVRTRGHVRFSPQYSLYPHSIAFNQRVFRDSALFIYYENLASVARSVGSDDFLSLMTEHVSKLDYTMLTALSFRNFALFENQDALQQFFASARQHHGDELIDPLQEAVESLEINNNLSRFRRVCKDPDVRLFIALLMNSPGRKVLQDILQRELPDVDPSTSIAELLNKVIAHKKEAAQLIFDLATQHPETKNYQLVSDISAAMPKGLSEDEQFAFILDAISETGTDTVTVEQLPESRQLQNIPEIAGLFR